MTKPWSLQVGGIHLGSPLPAAAQPLDPEAPFRVLLVGDFSGRGNRPGARPPDWKPLAIDRDNFDAVLARLGVELSLRVPDRPEPLTLRFSELDDFGPDRLYDKVELFEQLRQLRRQLKNPATFSRAAAEVRGWAGLTTEAPPPPPPPPAAAELTDEDLLGVMLGDQPAPEAVRRTDPFQEFVRRLVAPYSTPGSSADEAALVGIVDEVAQARMRSILHQADFQALEAAWRAVWFLVRRLDTDDGLKLFLLDLTRAELATDLAASDLTKSRAYRLLVEQPLGTPGGVPWAVVAGNYTFSPTVGDGVFVARLAHLAQHAGAPFLAGAHSLFAGCPSFADNPDPDDWTATTDLQADQVWAALRQIPQASHIGLALPRVLMRLPYGKNGAECDSFRFEEMPASARHEDFLWGNAAFACAYLLSQAYNERGWRFQPGAVQDIDSLPAYIRMVDGERELLPCAEVLLRDRGAAILLDRGLIPVQSFQDRDAVRIARWPSLADPPVELAGRWS